MANRLDRDTMFFEMAMLLAERGTCERARVGALITRTGRIIGMGYNGAPPGMDHCEDVGCEIGHDGGCERTVHAEANAIAFAAQDGVEVGGASMYCTHAPCYTCAKLMLSAGIRVVQYKFPYRDKRGPDLLVAQGVLVVAHGQR